VIFVIFVADLRVFVAIGPEFEVQRCMAEDLRYPIGPFEEVPASDDVRAAAIRDLEELPAKMRAALAGLADQQLDLPYRPGGWTVRQVVHHVPDSHLNAYVRMKLALTEDAPVIKPYDEQAWAELPDSQLPVDIALALLDATQARLVAAYRALLPAQFARVYVHPEQGRPVTLDRHLQVYAWHSRHHVAHITSLRRREGW
jgi:hypothetical protein